jgi:hypothetical protein
LLRSCNFFVSITLFIKKQVSVFLLSCFFMKFKINLPSGFNFYRNGKLLLSDAIKKENFIFII